MQAKTYSMLAGTLVRSDRAAIAIADRGFRFGDGVFETIRIEKGVPYQWDLHIDRLRNGLAAIEISLDVDWEACVKRIIRKNSFKRGFLRIAVSRGVGSKGYLPYPKAMPATWVLELLPDMAAPHAPARLWLSQWARIPKQCLPSNYKLAQGLNNTLALLEAQKHGCDEALQLTTDGHLCEAAGANVFWITGDTLYTPPLTSGCLNGTTRDAIIRLSPVAVRTDLLGLPALQEAQAVFLSNSRVGIWPVASLSPIERKYQPHHRLIKQLSGLLRADREAYIHSHKKFWGAR